MNYRLLLLDFYYQYLFNQGVNYASFCFLDKSYTNNLAKAFYENQKINVYHIKAPRVFNKEYEYGSVENSILDDLYAQKAELESKIKIAHVNLSATKDKRFKTVRELGKQKKLANKINRENKEFIIEAVNASITK